MKFTVIECFYDNGKPYYLWELWINSTDKNSQAHGQAISVHHALLQIGAARRKLDAAAGWSIRGKR